MPVRFLVILFALAFVSQMRAVTFYRNTFDSSTSLNGFTVLREKFDDYSPPPLSSAIVQDGKLRIDTVYLEPNGPNTAPTLSGDLSLVLDLSTFGSVFPTTLADAREKITWAFNVAYEDGSFNNDFRVVLACTGNDPSAIPSKGYVFRGGGMGGNRMGLWRFDYGTGGGEEVLIDVVNGLAPMPDVGSFRITFDPATGTWSLYASIGTTFDDPRKVETLLGTAVDSTYTDNVTKYFAIGGGATGSDYFDNVTISIGELSDPQIEDLTAPFVTIRVPGKRLLKSETRMVRFAGSAMDVGGGVAKVEYRVNGQSKWHRATLKGTQWVAAVQMLAKNNVVAIRAIDLSGNESAVVTRRVRWFQP